MAATTTVSTPRGFHFFNHQLEEASADSHSSSVVTTSISSRPYHPIHNPTGYNGSQRRPSASTRRSNATATTSIAFHGGGAGGGHGATPSSVGGGGGGAGDGATTTNISSGGGGGGDITNLLDAMFAQKKRHEEAALAKQEAAGAGTGGRGLATLKGFTLPLMGFFAIQNITIVMCVIIICVMADLRATKLADELVEDSIRASLLYAGTEISAPISAGEQYVVEYRARYSAEIVMSGYASSPCYDGVQGVDADLDAARYSFQKSQNFYTSALLGMYSNARIFAIFSSTLLPSMDKSVLNFDTAIPPNFYSFSNGTSQCSLARDGGMYRRYGNASITSYDIPQSIDSFDGLDSMPRRIPVPGETHPHEDAHISLTMMARRLTINPFVKVDAQRTFLLISTPIRYSFRNLSSDTITYSNEVTTPMLAYLGNPEVDQSSFTVETSLGMGFDMIGFYEILVSITPNDSDSHTTLYNMETMQTIASSGLPAENGQVDMAGGLLFLAGATPSSSVNTAFANSLAGKTAGEIELLVGTVTQRHVGDNIITSYVFELSDSHTNFGVVQSTPRIFYYESIDSLRVLMIALGCFVAFFISFICITIAILINLAVSRLSRNMALAAAFKNDRVEPISSYVWELNRITKGFHKLNDLLLEARQYLPQHMLLTSSSDEDHDDEEGTVEPIRRNGGRGGGASCDDTERSARTSDTQRNSSEGRGHRKNGGGGKAAIDNSLPAGAGGGAASGGMVVKRVTILSINVRNIHKLFNMSAPATFVGPLNDLTELAVVVAHAHKGMIDAFHGDHYVMSFNVSRQNAEGPQKACRAALDIAAAASSQGNMFSMGISTGRAAVGNMGSVKLKKLSVVGAVYSRAMAMERLCKRFNPPSDYLTSSGDVSVQCVLDSAVANEVQHSFSLQALGGAYGAPFHAMSMLPPPPSSITNNNNNNPLSASHNAGAGGGGGATEGDGMQLQLQNAITSLINIVDDAGDEKAPAPGMTAAAHPAKVPALPPPPPPPQQLHFSAPQQAHFEVCYALRAANAATSACDEWLYELNANRSSLLVDINNAILKYVEALPTDVFDRYYQSSERTGTTSGNKKAGGAPAAKGKPQSAARGGSAVSKSSPAGVTTTTTSAALVRLRAALKTIAAELNSNANAADKSGGAGTDIPPLNGSSSIPTVGERGGERGGSAAVNGVEPIVLEAFRYARFLAYGGDAMSNTVDSNDNGNSNPLAGHPALNGSAASIDRSQQQQKGAAANVVTALIPSRHGSAAAVRTMSSRAMSNHRGTTASLPNVVTYDSSGDERSGGGEGAADAAAAAIVGVGGAAVIATSSVGSRPSQQHFGDGGEPQQYHTTNHPVFGVVSLPPTPQAVLPAPTTTAVMIDSLAQIFPHGRDVGVRGAVPPAASCARHDVFANEPSTAPRGSFFLGV